MAWLLLIPLFNLVWIFFIVLGLAQSYQSYFQAQGRTDVGDCGYGIGLAYCICVVLSIIPLLNYLTGVAALVLLILVLVKAFTLRNMIPTGV